MLVYYILSGGHHPFGEDVDCESNILRGRYSLEHLNDDVAKDLVEWMINENPEERPMVEQTFPGKVTFGSCFELLKIIFFLGLQFSEELLVWLLLTKLDFSL